jgi:cytochrome c
MGGEFYKVWGAALIALTVAFGIGIAINHITHSDHMDIKAYAVAVPDGGTETAAVVEEKVLEPVSPLLASADIAAGEKAFKRCATCHSVEKGGANKVGPNLYNVVGAAKGHEPSFNYSDALMSIEAPWDYENLNAFFAKPKDYAPGTKMNFAGLSKPQDRANVIAYLRQYADNPPPMPDPAAVPTEAPAEAPAETPAEAPAQ